MNIKLFDLKIEFSLLRACDIGSVMSCLSRFSDWLRFICRIMGNVVIIKNQFPSGKMNGIFTP